MQIHRLAHALIATLSVAVLETSTAHAESVVLDCTNGGSIHVPVEFDEAQGWIVRPFSNQRWQEGAQSDSSWECVQHVSFSSAGIRWWATGSCNAAQETIAKVQGTFDRSTGTLNDPPVVQNYHCEKVQVQ